MVIYPVPCPLSLSRSECFDLFLEIRLEPEIKCIIAPRNDKSDNMLPAEEHFDPSENSSVFLFFVITHLKKFTDLCHGQES